MYNVREKKQTNSVGSLARKYASISDIVPAAVPFCFFVPLWLSCVLLERFIVAVFRRFPWAFLRDADEMMMMRSEWINRKQL